MEVFTRNEAKKLKQLNSVKNNQLSIENRIIKAKLSEKLQKAHYNRARARLRLTEKIRPYLLGLKIIKCLHVKSYNELLTNYYVVNKKNASRFTTNNNQQNPNNDVNHNI